MIFGCGGCFFIENSSVGDKFVVLKLFYVRVNGLYDIWNRWMECWILKVWCNIFVVVFNLYNYWVYL